MNARTSIRAFFYWVDLLIGKCMPLFMTRSPNRNFAALSIVGTILSGLLISHSVQAQSAKLNEVNADSVGLDVRLFRSAIDSKGYISVNGTDILGHKEYSFGLVLDMGSGIVPYTAFEWDPTVSSDPDDDNPYTKTHHLVTTAITGTLHFNYGIQNTGVVGLEIPIQAIRGPKAVVPGAYNDVENPTGLDSQGFGDISVHGKLRILRRERGPLGLAAILKIGLPTGSAEAFRGEPGVSLWPIAATEWAPITAFRVGLNVGYRYNSGRGAELPFDGETRPAIINSVYRRGSNPNGYSGALLFPEMCEGEEGGDVTNATCPGRIRGFKKRDEYTKYNDLLTFGAAAALRFIPSAELIVEGYGGQIVSAMGDPGALGIETIAGLKIFVEKNSFLMIAGGIGAVHGLNSADYRGVLAFVFEPSIGDRDGDGYKDDVDKCPDDPEDFDGFEDEEGCPDPDNDRDGILDIYDECPLVPEDRDGDADEDGCPEGIIGDRDGDGILDNVDKCPDDPEDRDGFQDEDGCPDPDNDKDGIPDVKDMCPNDPEDKDGFEDQDGCPDPDNDHDRILDVDDKCPNDPETYNGFEDEDGCPDRGNVVIEENQIIILEKIYFATNSAEILPRSFPIVDAVASTLIGNPQITYIEIQGHADERATDQYNIDLTRDRAASVLQALVERGVAPNRLRSAGYGERCPIDPGHNEAAWEKNRRVEFKIIATDAGPTGVEVTCKAAKDLIPE
jgi:OmpA-OmpF porin, OOP family